MFPVYISAYEKRVVVYLETKPNESQQWNTDFKKTGLQFVLACTAHEYQNFKEYTYYGSICAIIPFPVCWSINIRAVHQDIRLRFTPTL